MLNSVLVKRLQWEKIIKLNKLKRYIIARF